MTTKERLNNRVAMCLGCGHYSFMLAQILSEAVVPEPRFFGAFVMSKVNEPSFMEFLRECKLENYSDPLKLNDTWSVIECAAGGCYIYSDNEYYFMTR